MRSFVLSVQWHARKKTQKRRLQVAHMSLWVMAASPLLTCVDPRTMSAEIKAILTNPEVLAIHKDPLARMVRS